MKKSIIILIVLVIVGLIIWKFGSNGSLYPKGVNTSSTLPETYTGSTTPAIPISEKTKISDKVTEYKNEELGISVKYPSAWQVEESPASIGFVVPIDSSGKNTINKLESKIEVVSGKCAFPPVTTIKERTTTKVGDFSFNMISMSNNVQGRNYFNRMYTLQKDSICYVFSFLSITLNPTTKGFSGGQVQQVNVNNKAIVDTADSQFKDLVKSFTFVVGPAGQDEAKVSPKK